MSIFPKEILENTTEVFRFRHTVRSKIIYTIILCVLIIGIALLPFIKVDVYSSAQGLIKPNKERVPISLISSGQILYSTVDNNNSVKRGDTLLILDNNVIDEQIKLSMNKIEDVTNFAADLSYLINAKDRKIDSLKSGKYQKELLQYEQGLNELQTRFSQAKRTLNRNKTLYDKGIISQANFETIEYEYRLAVNQINQYRQQQSSKWQADLTTNQNLMEELQSNENQLLDSKSQYVVTSPVDGTLLNAIQLETGGFINQGTSIAEISPDTNLIVECYVSPQDIGLLRLGSSAIFQIDAYNYNQWGLVEGKIIEIGNDIEVMNGNAIFKVRCSLSRDFLELKNGFKGTLKKGMSLNAQFILTERSLYDLLYDKVDDWMNPSRV